MFDDIRPYYDSEIPDSMRRIAGDSHFDAIAQYAFPDKSPSDVRQMVLSINTISDFQNKIMYWANKRIIEKSIDEFTFGGLENIDRKKKYLFVSNHRDIMLDASLLQIILIENGIDTCEITFGANLMQGELVIDIGKSNKMFRVERPGGNVREFYLASLHLSEYIRHTLLEKGQSVWIAQRNGRTKDGVDRTDQGIIKMFGMSRTDDRVKSLSELNIIPVSVSYEWESCDILKTMELYISNLGPYTKHPGEDLNSILTGVNQPKGRVHFEICKPLSEEDLNPYATLPAGDFNRKVASMLDKRICTSYKLWPNNYIAHDILNNSSEYSQYYTAGERCRFLSYMDKFNEYSDSCEVEELRKIFLGIYAGPVYSMINFI